MKKILLTLAIVFSVSMVSYAEDTDTLRYSLAADGTFLDPDSDGYATGWISNDGLLSLSASGEAACIYPDYAPSLIFYPGDYIFKAADGYEIYAIVATTYAEANDSTFYFAFDDDEPAEVPSGWAYVVDKRGMAQDSSVLHLSADFDVDVYWPAIYIYDASDYNYFWVTVVKKSADAISEVKATATNADSKIYDLLGREVANPRHGIYIQNGKKRLYK